MGERSRLRAGIPLRDRDSSVMSEIDAKQLSMDYGRRVRELRKEKNLTQRQLSEITGLKREYISLIEHGRTDMQLSTFLKIADALDVQISM
ncbi:helix-turn-helix domain-containing protein [uncultured Alistipes sp.]